MFVTITSDTEPTTRPDGSPLEESDKWVNGDITKVWQIACYTEDDILYYNDAADESTHVDANTYHLSANDVVIPETSDELITPDTTALPGQWVTEGESITITVDGVTMTADPLPIFDESDFA